jgi:hypothetical protein
MSIYDVCVAQVTAGRIDWSNYMQKSASQNSLLQSIVLIAGFVPSSDSMCWLYFGSIYYFCNPLHSLWYLKRR